VIRREPDLFDGLPDYSFEPHHVEWEGIRIHYVDEGSGPPVVLFHGEPTWSFLYRNVVPRLVAAGYRAIAPDMPGFGKSDVPTDPAFYTYDTLVASMNHLVDALDLEDATAVVQDWGGPVGLRTAVERRDRFRRLVIMNTGLYTRPGRVTPAFEAWRQFVERTPDLPVGMVMRNAATRDWGDETLAGYEAPFPTRDHKIGAWRLPLIVPLQDDDPGAAEMRAVGAALTEWQDPVLVLFADHDPIFHVGVGERFASVIPGAGPVEVVEGAGHFLQEEEPEVVADAIEQFLDRTA
jgi:haloalkane dehalogenase